MTELVSYLSIVPHIRTQLRDGSPVDLGRGSELTAELARL